MKSVIAFLVIFSLIIFVHELGHFLVFRAIGVKVQRFAIGILKILGIQIGETEYILGLLPLGGYVQEEGNSFESKSPYLRLLVILAGAFGNFLLAIFLLWYLFVAGFPSLAPVIGEVIDQSPAFNSGFQKGDIFVSIEGKDISSWKETVKIISDNPEKKLNFLIKRNGQLINLVVVPEKRMVGNIIEKKEGGFIGVSPTGEITNISYSIGAAFLESIKFNYENLRLIVLALTKMITGGLGFKESVAGPIGIGKIVHEVAQTSYVNLILLTAMLSLTVGFMNLLPIPVLDGGHIPFLVWEMIFGKKVDKKIQDRARAIGLVLLITLFIIATYFDILKFF